MSLFKKKEIVIYPPEVKKCRTCGHKVVKLAEWEAMDEKERDKYEGLCLKKSCMALKGAQTSYTLKGIF
ncbi:MAG: hypothetical protein LBM02_07340 [Lachnospiraceae bacterium]|jgi:predicted Fe-S protein YdhL (DUF1289 family)|nr:hypothetical protein [Lachnospiraceae bacterium]